MVTDSEADRQVESVVRCGLSTPDEQVMAVVRQTAHVWSDDADAQAWLTAPHPDLGGQRPLDAAEDADGARLVLRLLDRMIYGLPA